ncbi:MAG TPA: hypothetical protein V6D02_10470 [Candidatus Obscuribacterales bacterium]
MVSFTRSLLSAACLGGLLGGLVYGPAAQAAPAATAPAELVAAIEAIEAAANAQNIDQVMALHAPDFEGADGFTAEQYAATLTAFWQQYSRLTYAVELLSWEPSDTGFVAETRTLVDGTQVVSGRAMTLTAEVRSRQEFVNGLVTRQEILTETSRLIAGQTPPNVQVQLPPAVRPGQNFSFDAIVAEPLGDRLLLGVAFDEGTTATDFLTPRPVDLEALSAGGLFKIGKAPAQPDQRWISAVLIRADGMVIDTRRLRVGNP